MGFSAVSIIEIFYFLTIRPYCAARKKLQIHKAVVRSVNIGKPKKIWKVEKETANRFKKITLTPVICKEKYEYLE